MPNLTWVKNQSEKYKDLILTEKKKNPLLNVNQLTKHIIDTHRIRYNADVFRKVVSKIITDKEPEPIIYEEDEILLPQSDYIEHPPFVLPKSCQRILALYDIHIPYHNSKALTIALKYGIEHNTDTIFLGGDILDCYQISRYVKNPLNRRFKGELELGKEFLAELRRLFPDAKIYYKIGNHELRFMNYVLVNAPAFADLKELSFDKLLDFDLYRVEMIDELTVTKAGGLNLLHGHELLGGGVNLARTQRLKAMDNIMTGHNHYTQTDISKTILDKPIGGWKVACLAGLHPDYMPINGWNNGFAFIQVEDDGTFSVENKQIINGMIK